MKRHLIFVLLLAACTDGSGPDDDGSSRYQLSRLDGRPLPQVAADGQLARIVFLSGALHLKSNGIFFDSTVMDVTTKATGETKRTVNVAQGLYTTSRDTVYFRSVNRPGEDYMMVKLTEGSLIQRLSTIELLYVR
jgi:hypothetical protein